jgi:hypothetical protein
LGFASTNNTNYQSHNPPIQIGYNPIVIPSRTFSSSDAEEFRNGKPTLKYASSLNKTWASMSNEQILHFAHMEVPEACRECVIRDVMMVDQIEYDEVRY